MAEAPANGAPEAARSRDVPTRRTGVRGLASDVAVYGTTRAFLKALAFILIPVYAHFLSPAEFGQLELVLALVALVDVIIAANVDGVFARFYHDHESREWRRGVITIYLLLQSVYPAVVVGILLALSQTLASGILDNGALAIYFVIALIDLYLTNIVDLPMVLARLRHKRGTFVVYSLSRGLTQIAVSVVLVAVFGLGVKGILIASLSAVCVAFVVTAREWVFDLTRRVDWRLAVEMIHFAWPGILSGLAFYGLGFLDRFFINHYHGEADTGLYGVAFRYSQIVIIATFAFRLGWAPWHYSWLHSGRHAQMVARGAMFFFFAVGFLAVLVSAWILPVFELLLPEKYWDASRAVAPLALAAYVTGVHRVVSIGMNVMKKMRMIAPLAVISSGVAVGLYFLLIPPFSYVGAAWATVAALSLFALLVGTVSQRFYPVPWGYRRMALVFTAALGLCLASLAVDAWLPTTESLAVRAAITLLFPAGLVALGYFPREDVDRATRRLRAALGR